MTSPPFCLRVLHYSATHPLCHGGQRGSRRTELTWGSQFLGDLQRSPWWSSSAIPSTAPLRLCTDSSCLLKEMSKATGVRGFPQGKATFLPWADTKFLLSSAKTLQRGCFQKRSKVIWAVTSTHSFLIRKDAQQHWWNENLALDKYKSITVLRRQQIQECSGEGVGNYLTLPFA